MDREVICLLLEALGGEFVLGDTEQIIECTSNRDYVTTNEKGVGYKMTLVHVPQKPGILVMCDPDPDSVPVAQEGRLEIRPLTPEEREQVEEDE